MRFSASLQDFSTYTKVDPAATELDLEADRGYTHAKPLRALQKEGAASSFSKEKPLLTTSSVRKKWTRAIICVTAILLLLLLIFACKRYLSSSSSPGSSEYYVILDCGSTGTRVFVYEWSTTGKYVTSNLPIILKSLPGAPQRKSSAQSGRAYQRMETEPGFDKLVHNESGLRAAIQPLIQWAEGQIPKHAHKSTSLFLYATAGVRRLPNSDSEWLLDKAWSILKNSSFMCRRDSVKTITGMEEAYYGWIALNYHNGILGSLPVKHTFGALDLGGSSLQVTFETEKPVHDDTGINLSIGAVNHHLSAYSLSSYGLNDAFDKSVAHLLKKLSGTAANLIDGKIELMHPCLQTGYREKYMCSQCAAVAKEGSPMVGGRAFSKGSPVIATELVGSPHWEECSALAKITVNLSEWSNLDPGIDCERKPCALSDNLPHPRGQFYAMSGFFVVFRFFNLTSDSDLNNLLQSGQEFCRKTWEVAKNSVTPQPFIEQYCFRAPYIVSLVRDGLHIRDSQVVIGSGSITWTLGVALLEAGQALARRTEFNGFRILHRDINPIVLLVMLLMSIIVLICAVSCVGKWMPGFFHRAYLRLFRHNNPSTTTRNITPTFNFQRWSPVNAGDGRTKTPLSPVANSEFDVEYGFGGSGIELVNSPLHPFGVSHSYSSGSLPQLQFVNGTASRIPNWGRTLQNRRSASREDLTSSSAEIHPVT